MCERERELETERNSWSMHSLPLLAAIDNCFLIGKEKKKKELGGKEGHGKVKKEERKGKGNR